MNVQTTIPAAIDFAAVKTKQQATWSSGDYTVEAIAARSPAG